MDDIEKAIEENLDREAARNMLPRPDLQPRPNGSGKLPGSVAEQMLAVAAVVKGIHQDIDRLQTEMIQRLDEIRRRLGSKA